MANVHKDALAAIADVNSIVVIPDTTTEAEVCMRWLRKNAKAAVDSGRVYEELEIPAIQRGTSIVFVFRDVSEPLEAWALDDENRRVRIPRPAADLDAEIIVTAPVKVDSYWDQAPMRAGRPNVPALLERMNALIAPYRLGYSDATSPSPSCLRMRRL